MALSTTAIGYQIAGLKVMADLLAAKSSHPNRQRMPEHIPRVPPRLDPLQARVVPFVIQCVPWHAGCVQGRVRKVGVGMIDECPIARLPRDREDRKSTRLNSSHLVISYAVFCLKKKKNISMHESSKQQI